MAGNQFELAVEVGDGIVTALESDFGDCRFTIFLQEATSEADTDFIEVRYSCTRPSLSLVSLNMAR